MIIGVVSHELMYLVIRENKFSREPLNSVVERISSIDEETIHLGYDIHAGFNFPDNTGLRLVLESSPKYFIVEPTLIDEREQSGKNPYSPTQVHVEIKGKRQRIRVAESGSTYVSRLPLDIKRIEDAYRQLSEELYQEHIRPLFEEIVKYQAENLGEFLRLMHFLLLKQQIGQLPNVSLSDMRFDKYNLERGDTDHNVLLHKEQQVLYIALHKVAIGDERSLIRVIEKFAKAREERHLGTNPIYIITPLNPRTYFWGE